MAKDAVATMGGLLPPDVSGRDAVHVAVFSAVSAVRLNPGQRVAILTVGEKDTEVAPIGTHVAIVDPFVEGVVRPGERFWAYLYPRTITALSHKWSHPAFEETNTVYASPSEKLSSEAWLRSFCDRSNCPGYEEVIAAAARVARGRSGSDFSSDYLHIDGSDAHGEIPPEFWDHVANVLGAEIIGPKARYFSCSC